MVVIDSFICLILFLGDNRFILKLYFVLSDRNIVYFVWIFVCIIYSYVFIYVFKKDLVFIEWSYVCFY